MKKGLFSFPKHVWIFLLIAYAFSFTLWFIGWYLADARSVDILLNNDIIGWQGQSDILLPTLLFAIATLGPFIGAMVVRKQSEITYSGRGVQYTLLTFLILAGLQFVFTAFARLDGNEPAGTTINYVLFALLYFAFTSGTEEFGWRGVLYPHIRDHTNSLWDSSIYTGLIWGVWHIPFLLYIFVGAQNMGTMATVFSIVGFMVTIIMQSFLHGWVNVRGGSTISSYLLHILLNVLPIFIAFMLGTNESFTLIITIGSYLLTMFVLDRAFPTDQYFETATM